MQLTHSPVRLWQRAIKVNQEIQDLETKRQSRLLNTTLIILIFAVSIINGISLVQDMANDQFPMETTFITPFTLVLLAVYFINRASYYKSAAYTFIGASYALLMLYSLQDFGIIIYFASLVVVGAMFLTNRETQILALLASLTALALVATYFGAHDSITPIFASNFIIIAIPTTVIYIQHRHKIEQERLASLAEANNRLRENEALLEQRVKERTAELADAKHQTDIALARALEADKLKSQFLASMSHELRTPLNSILTFNELMMMGTFGEVNDEQKDYLGKSLQSGRHLLSLINDVLDITKIQSGMMKLFIEEDFDFTLETLNVVQTAQNLLHDKPVEVHADIDDDLPNLTCDKRRIRQVMLNLMSNATKFTEQGSITISAKQQDDHLLFIIDDTGPGIPAKQQQMIFEPFVQTEAGIQHIGGTGLGLPISKRLVEAHGGQLWVESTPGEGAAFFVKLPLQTQLQLGETEV